METSGIGLIKQGCELIKIQCGLSEEENRLRSAIVLLNEATVIIKSVPGAGGSGALRWRIYELLQAQEGSDDSALYKELRCSICIGLSGSSSDPTTLPCGHSFCKSCIAPLFTRTQCKCPQCRAPITISYDSLRTTVAIKGISDHLLPLRPA